MMARRTVMGLLAGAVLLSRCGGRKEYRYKMTVEVETPQGVKSGSSVWAIMPYETNSLVGPQAAVDFRGEAVVVDIAPGQSLFALLTSADGDPDYAKQLPGRALGSRFLADEDDDVQWCDSADLYPSAPKTVGLARTNPLPKLVTFRDMRDPASVQKVEPGALDTAFGPGVKLRRIILQATDEDVTTGIGERLVWLGNAQDREGMLNGDRFEDFRKKETAAHISPFEFSTKKQK